MATSISSIKTEFEDAFKKDLTDVSNTIFIHWCNYINEFWYRHAAGVDPERLISLKTYTITVFPQTSTLPTDFAHIQSWQSGFYELELNKIGFTAQTQNFVVGRTLTGATSGATATIGSVVDDGTTGVITYSSLSGTFNDNETITGSGTSGGSATSNIDNVLTNTKLARTHPGSKNKGYYITGTSVIFTGYSTATSIVLRYIPTVTALTATTDNFSIPDEYDFYILQALDVLYTVWDEEKGDENFADARFVRALDEMTRNLRKEPAVYGLQDYSSYY